MEKQDLFIPAGFDTPNLIRESFQTTPALQSTDGTDLGYEDVLRPQLEDLASNKFSARAAGAGVAKKEDEAFFECEDWQNLL